jgi:streptogramin lyase
MRRIQVVGRAGVGAAVALGLFLACSATLWASGEPATLTSWQVPTSSSTPAGILVADGVVYVAEAHANKLARLDPSANTFTEWDVGQGPERVALGPASGIYFTERWADHIGRILPGGSFYTSESSGAAGSEPIGLVADLAGVPSLWYTERGVSKIAQLTLGGLLFDVLQVRVPATQVASPATTALTPGTTVVSPTVTPGNPALPPGIALAARTSSGPLTEWTVSGGFMQLRDLVLTPSGTFFVSTETRSILELDPSADTVLFHDLPTGSMSLRLALDAAGRVWFTESRNEKVGRLDPATGEVVEWRVTGSQPLAIAVATDGTVWYSDRERDKIAHLDPATGDLTEYALGSNANPTDVFLDASGDVWFSTEQNWIGRLAVGPVLGTPPLPDAITAVHVSSLSSTEARVTVDFTYSGSHGVPVFVGGLPTVGGVESASFGYVPEAIAAAGAGSVSFTVTYLGAGCTSTDGFDVYIYDATRSTFLFYPAALPMTWGSCGPSSIGLPSIALSIDRGCGGAYSIGDAITISITPSESMTATLVDFQTGGMQSSLALGAIPAGTTRIVHGTITGPAGVEGLAVMAETTAGLWTSAGCTLGVGGASPTSVSVSVDRGCGAVYHHGETATAILQSSVVGVARLYQVTRDGHVAGVSTLPIFPGVTERISAPISATSGTSTFVLQVTSALGQVLAATCSYDVVP